MLGLPRGPPCFPAFVPGTKPEHTSSSCGLSLSFRKPSPWRPMLMPVWPDPEPPPSWSLNSWRLAVPICPCVLQEHHGFPGLSRHVW